MRPPVVRPVRSGRSWDDERRCAGRGAGRGAELRAVAGSGLGQDEGRAHHAAARRSHRNDSSALLATVGAMALILLNACANVAALVLGQLHARSVELAVRSALGADRRRLIQPLLQPESRVRARASRPAGRTAPRRRRFQGRAAPADRDRAGSCRAGDTAPPAGTRNASADVQELFFSPVGLLPEEPYLLRVRGSGSNSAPRDAP